MMKQSIQSFNKTIKSMNRLTLLLLVFLTWSVGAAAKEKPNVIIIMTDDPGYGELSVHGNPVLQTPDLDKLYHQSVRLIDFHVAQMCTPTRGHLVTGTDAAKIEGDNVSSGGSLLRRELKKMRWAEHTS